MKTKLKQMGTSFIVMIVLYNIFSSSIIWKLGLFDPQIGLLLVLGLLFGPYGALGATLGNIVLELYHGFSPPMIIPSTIFSFGISILAYKLWYSGFGTDKITKPKLDNTYHLLLFISIITVCGFIFSLVHGNLGGIFFGAEGERYVFVSYFLNFFNVAFIFGIISILISKNIDFIATPQKSKRASNKRFYQIVFYSLIAVTMISSISIVADIDKNIMIVVVALIGILLFCYLTKPFEYEIYAAEENTVIEKVMRNFLLIILAITIIGSIISFLSQNFIEGIPHLNLLIEKMPMLIINDIFIILFLIPGFIILRYVEDKVLKPISSFSEIERFIKENEKIEATGLVEMYSKYVDEQNEIGTLARSYTDLINHNNNYIENIHEIESEKEHIKTELDIATKIQAAALPTEPLETDDFIVDGYSKPAKEVGGDFFDYYQLDDGDLAIVIGDVSGKGVPAALVAMTTQVIIKQSLNHEKDPSKVLYSLNNQISGNNPEMMFITLWIGIYNKTARTLTFSNAGHNPPLIRENGKFRYLDIDSGIVLGIMEEFEYALEEITLTDEVVLYTDGITDANNDRGEMYGLERLLKFFNEFDEDGDPITPLLNDISNFTENQEQFDDMTLTYLRITCSD